MRKNAKAVTVIMQPEIQAVLKQWADSNLTSVSAEVARAVRERIARERPVVVEAA